MVDISSVNNQLRLHLVRWNLCMHIIVYTYNINSINDNISDSTSINSRTKFEVLKIGLNISRYWTRVIKNFTEYQCCIKIPVGHHKEVIFYNFFWLIFSPNLQKLDLENVVNFCLWGAPKSMHTGTVPSMALLNLSLVNTMMNIIQIIFLYYKN